MFTLTKEFKFEAAHKLPKHDGRCARLHGHSFKMRVILMGTPLHCDGGPKEGMLMDFGDVSKAVNPLVEAKLDHHYLNETTELESPTSEELARWIFRKLRSALPLLVAVEVDETCTCRAKYQP